MLKYTQILLVLLTPLLLGSCLTAKHVNYFQPAGDGIASYPDTLDFEDYAIRPGDKLYIRVYTTDEETYKVLNGLVSGSSSLNYMSKPTLILTATVTFIPIASIPQVASATR